MAYNVNYSDSRVARKVYLGSEAVGRSDSQQLNFLLNSQVLFDRYTLSLKDGRLSLFSPDGLLKLQLKALPEVEEFLANSQHKESVMFQHAQGYVLSLAFGEGVSGKAPPAHEAPEFLVVMKEQEVA